MPPKDDLERRLASMDNKNKRLQRKVTDLSYRCNMQSKVLEAGNLSTLQVLLDQLMAFINAQIKRIMTEMLYAEFEPADTIALYKFRESLLSVHRELGIFTALSDGIVYSGTQTLREKHSAIGDALERLNGIPAENLLEIEDEQDRLLERILQILEERNAS